MKEKRALVIGFYSTIGDIDSLKIVLEWLSEKDVQYTVAPFGGPVLDAIPGSVLPETVDPQGYTHVIVVCGPCDRDYYAKRWPINPQTFKHCHFIGVNLSMIQSHSDWEPFDTLLERDSDQKVRPDLTLILEPRVTPVFGLCLAPSQPEYKDRQLHAKANYLLKSLARKMNAAVIEIDTGWPKELNKLGLESGAQIESVISRVDVLCTTRLHGTVYALKNGVPPLVLDPIKGGGKVIQQTGVLGWPSAYLAETVQNDDLFRGLEFCLSEKGKKQAQKSAAQAKYLLAEVREEFMSALKLGPQGASLRWPERNIERRSLARRVKGFGRRYAREFCYYVLKVTESD